MSIWDDPELKSNSNFVSFDSVGDTVSGTILAVKRHRFDDGGLVPQIILRCDDGEERTLTAGQTRLKLALTAQRPDEGDHLKVPLTQIEKRSGGKTLKHFDVLVRRGNGPVPASASAETSRAKGSSAPPF